MLPTWAVMHETKGSRGPVSGFAQFGFLPVGRGGRLDLACLAFDSCLQLLSRSLISWL